MTEKFKIVVSNPYKHIDLFHYCLIEREGWLGLHTDIWIDNFNLYKVYGTKPCIFFRNGYGKKDKVLPLTISVCPQVPIPSRLKISVHHYLELCAFIKKYKDTLIKLAHGEICEFPYQDEFKELLSEEKRILINEMPVLNRELTGLPMRIWIDNNETYKLGKHGKRIKFDDGKSKKTTSWPSLTIPDFETVPEENEITASNKNINLLRSFCLLNDKLINDLMDKKITLEFFKQNMIKVDKKGYPIKNEKPYYLYKEAGYGYKIVVNKSNGLFCIINNNGKFIINKWFLSISELKKTKSGKLIAYVTLPNDEEYYILTNNGEIRQINY